MNANTELIHAPKFEAPVCSIAPVALQMREAALEKAALIGRVQTAAQNEECFAARKQIRSLLSLFEKERKQLTDPLGEAARKIKGMVDEQKLALEQEDFRLAGLEKGFLIAEETRKREELERQERERQRIEDQRQQDLVAATTQAEVQNIEERAEVQTHLASQPVETARAKGQVLRPEIVIDQINDLPLLKARPDLAREIKWDVVGIKNAIRNGERLPGVRFHEDMRVEVRGKKNLAAVNV